MRKAPPAASPDAYVEALDGWRHERVDALRHAIRSSARLEERIKWGNIVYFSNGPALMLRAEEERVLLGFWRGQRLRAIEPRLKPGGKYEMATLELREGDTITTSVAKRLVKEAVRLNSAVGDPTAIGQ